MTTKTAATKAAPKKKAPVKRKAANAKAAKTLTVWQKVVKWVKENLMITYSAAAGTVTIVLMSIPF